MPRVNLPPGCYGIDFPDGTRYNPPRRGAGHVQVSDRHADAIRRGWYGQAGVMVADEQHAMGTKTGRWCVACTPARIWNAWNALCPRCGTPTTEEKP